MKWQLVVVAVLGSACVHRLGATLPATTIKMDFTRAGGFFSAPFPNEDLRTADDHIDLSGFPGRGSVGLIDAALDQIESDARGFSLTSGIFFSATDELDPYSVPQSAAESLKPHASVYLVDVERGDRVPVDVSVFRNGGRFGEPNLIAIVPYQGIPLRESTLYAAVITTGVKDAWGRPLGLSDSMRQLVKGRAPRGIGLNAFTALKAALPLAKGAAAIAVFKTDAPRTGMMAVREAMRSEHPVPDGPLKLTDRFADYCAFQSTIQMPQYQSGTPPFRDGGGKWVFDADGLPVRQRYDTARILLTLPRGPMPPGGWPTVIYARAGSGGDRPLIDHGAADAWGQIQPGSGPALEFARAGFAAVSIDGPLGGLRNPQKEDEQFRIFNFDNPSAIRDNIRQSAAELMLNVDVLERLTVDATACKGDAHTRFDSNKVALFGHSMGATIAPLALAYEPRFGAAILSGFGGSFIANVMHKQKPLPVRRIAELMFGYTFRLFSITQGDPALSMLQWAMEPADPPIYGALAKSHVLMFQGIVDHYILPPMANASSLSLGLDLAGDELDKDTPELHGYATFRDVAAFSGRGVLPYPVEGNLKRPDGSHVTAAVVQRPGDGIQDGHELIFQTAGTKFQYRCFLSTFAVGSPQVVAPMDSVEMCGHVHLPPSSATAAAAGAR